MKDDKVLKILKDVDRKTKVKRSESGHKSLGADGAADASPVAPVAEIAADAALANPAPVLPPPVPRIMPRHTIESVSIAEGGGVFIAGWINDTADELGELRIAGPTWAVRLAGDGLARVCRDDVQAALGIPRRHPFGFWGLVTDTAVDAGSAGCLVEVVMKSGASERHEVPLRVLFDQIELRNLALTYLSSSTYMGNPLLDSVACLERAIGKEIVDVNVLISRAIASRPLVERFGVRAGRRYKGSIIVCLYGRAEYLTLQAALFSGLPGIEDYEFVYVSNSPELAEQLGRDAHIAARAYGIPVTLVLLPGNAGFGAANNIAVAVSESDRCLIVNPDVFPYHRDWAARHTTLIDEAPAAQTRLFGAPLYYDDGSLMHAGMYFDGDGALSMEGARFRRNFTLRVEHFGKGAPPDATEFLRPRPVPAVTGAFISCERAWFEKLGGFSEEYVLGHYEDADLCLKSLGEGAAPWLHDIRFWHLEGKGSGRRQAAHEGASIVNRWLFNRRWGEAIVPQILGQRPSHRLLQVAPAAPALPLAARAEKPAAKIQVRTKTPHAFAKPVMPATPGLPLRAGQAEIVFGAEA